MPLIVFLRGVNVGGHKAFRPSVLAKEMAELDVASVGAAGTFVVRKKVSEAALRAEFERRLPFASEIMICKSGEIEKLVSVEPFARETNSQDIKHYVSILSKRPQTAPKLPISQPAGAEWQVKIIGLQGRFVLSLNRRLGRTLVYPNEVVEKQFGVPATTRNWSTIEAIGAALT